MKLIPGLCPNPIELCREAREPSSDCPRLPSYRAPLLSFMKATTCSKAPLGEQKVVFLGYVYVQVRVFRRCPEPGSPSSWVVTFFLLCSYIYDSNPLTYKVKVGPAPFLLHPQPPTPLQCPSLVTMITRLRASKSRDLCVYIDFLIYFCTVVPRHTSQSRT